MINILDKESKKKEVYDMNNQGYQGYGSNNFGDYQPNFPPPNYNQNLKENEHLPREYLSNNNSNQPNNTNENTNISNGSYPGQEYQRQNDMGYQIPQEQHYHPHQGYQNQHSYQSNQIRYGGDMIMIWPNHSVNTYCVCCQRQVHTQTVQKASSMAWALCILMIIFGCWLGCCLIPFCLEGFQETQHSCPHCFSFMGRSGHQMYLV
eukprot:TRINITY_DN7545_c0_g1_i1.p1 TRINITY_DN7545_c0_g1~~TRINITY_DN7545_c0_g1_i1.p1  ORF type:complete len:206 (+),score=32.52 TRINITY_DN7545_c0_g1_i1:18-635(+)